MGLCIAAILDDSFSLVVLLDSFPSVRRSFASRLCLIFLSLDLPVSKFTGSSSIRAKLTLGVNFAGSCSRENLRSLNADEATLLFATGDMM